MPHKHYSQHGIFHVITKTRNDYGWCTGKNIPEIIIDNIRQTRDEHGAKVFAFCLLSNHLHLLFSPGEKGLSKFMQSFKSNSTKDVMEYCRTRSDAASLLRKVGWQKGYYDERMKSNRQYYTAISYVRGNAARHRLVASAYAWPWTSLHFSELIDVPELWPD